MGNPWDERYQATHYVYGKEPNAFLKGFLAGCAPGRILFPAEGEGRNAVYAARLGWRVDAFDYSLEGQKKALALAHECGVTLHYQVCDALDFDPAPDQFDVVALIYNHFEPTLRSQIFPRLVRALKTGGTLLFEAFAQDQIHRSTGGPKQPSLLYTTGDLAELFPNLEHHYLRQELILLDEGPLHSGEASVVRMIAEKTI